jgi:hypothetical protein
MEDLLEVLAKHGHASSNAFNLWPHPMCRTAKFCEKMKNTSKKCKDLATKMGEVFFEVIT